jgi:hypothetical protein
LQIALALPKVEPFLFFSPEIITELDTAPAQGDLDPRAKASNYCRPHEEKLKSGFRAILRK